MYEKFTDRARKIFTMANQEAQRFNHEYIGTEHILLALAKEGLGTGATILKNLGVEPAKVSLEVNKLIQMGPDMVTAGKLPQTPRAKKVVEYAIAESRNLNHDYVGSEHVLLGLLREGEGVAHQTLVSLGITLEDARAELLSFLKQKVTLLEPKEQLKITSIVEATDSTVCIALGNDQFGLNLIESLRYSAALRGRAIEAIVVICRKQ